MMIGQQRKKIRKIFVLRFAAILTGSVIGFFVFAVTALARDGEIQVDVAEVWRMVIIRSLMMAQGPQERKAITMFVTIRLHIR